MTLLCMYRHKVLPLDAPLNYRLSGLRHEARESWVAYRAVGTSHPRNSDYKAEQGKHCATKSSTFLLRSLP